MSSIVDHFTNNMYVIDAIGHVTRKLSLGSSIFKSKNNEVELYALPLLADVPSHDQEDLFIKKLDQCCVAFDFQDSYASINGKGTKRCTFEELIKFVSTSEGVLTDKVYPEIVKMFSSNVFRVLPPSEYPDFDLNNDDPAIEATWPHLSQAYDLFLAFIESGNFIPWVAMKYLDEKFIRQLLELLDSEDPRERDYLKTILYRIYGKILNLRSYIRKQISHIFLRFAYETGKFNGVGELLEILGSIINGFTLPLKEEHKLFLIRVLFPLHKSPSMSFYHQQLTYCVAQFVEKDPSLTETVISLLLKLWPKTCSNKELHFLSELQDILNVIREEEFGKVVVPVYKKLAKSMASYHFQIAEKALSFCNNKYIFSLMAVHIDIVLPIVFPVLFPVMNQWSVPHINDLAVSFLKHLEEINIDIYNRCYKESLGQSSLPQTPKVSLPTADDSTDIKKYVENNNCVVTSF